MSVMAHMNERERRKVKDIDYKFWMRWGSQTMQTNPD
jgi:hypothetical protein